jgi:hypothetical protein
MYDYKINEVEEVEQLSKYQYATISTTTAYRYGIKKILEIGIVTICRPQYLTVRYLLVDVK